jgi:polyisoprenoid-binding protein YceI
MTQDVAEPFLAADRVGTWVLDPEASTVAISHKTMWGLMTVRGEFKAVTGDGHIDANGDVNGSLAISAASIDTGNKKRDEHLRSPDFFDVESYPAISVTLTSAVAEPDGLDLQTRLMVKDTTAPLPLLATITDSTPDSLTVQVQTTVDRKDFGLVWNLLSMVKGDATVSVNAVFRRAA